MTNLRYKKTFTWKSVERPGTIIKPRYTLSPRHVSASPENVWEEVMPDLYQA